MTDRVADGGAQIIPLCNAVDTKGMPKNVKKATHHVAKIIPALTAGPVRKDARR